jgi:hypothetical protein
MKKLIVVLFMLAGLWVGCSVDSSQTIHYRVNEPVFSSPETFRSSIRITSAARSLSACGKICFYRHHHLYISDPGKGIHIINNTDPAHPQIKGYIEIPGCQDMIIHDQQLYADALVDLVWFDLSDPDRPVLQGRSENLFPDALPATNNEYGYDYDRCQKGIAQGKIVTGWQVKERQRQNTFNGDYASAYPAADLVLSPGKPMNDATSVGSHFSLNDRYLYAIVNSHINIIDLSTPQPQKTAEMVHVGNVETILPYRNQLFLGTPAGLMIYSIEEPQRPTLCSQIAHVYGCNPIAIDNDLVYISIRSGNSCGQNTNELMIFDISNPKQPLKRIAHPLKNPKGLSVHNGLLFLCEEGLKVFQIGTPESLLSQQVGHFKEPNALDVIPFNDILFLIADNGLYQYEYADGKLRLISIVPIKK